MQPVESITREDHDVPQGTVAVVYAKDQPEYLPLPALRTPDGQVLTQWQPSDEERLRIAAGEPITLVCYTFNKPLQPLRLGVGRMTL